MRARTGRAGRHRRRAPPTSCAVDGQRAPVGGRVDAEGRAGDDRAAALAQPGGQVGRHVLAVRRGAASAHDRHRPGDDLGQPAVPADPQAGRRTAQVVQPASATRRPRGRRPGRPTPGRPARGPGRRRARPAGPGSATGRARRCARPAATLGQRLHRPACRPPAGAAVTSPGSASRLHAARARAAPRAAATAASAVMRPPADRARRVECEPHVDRRRDVRAPARSASVQATPEHPVVAAQRERAPLERPGRGRCVASRGSRQRPSPQHLAGHLGVDPPRCAGQPVAPALPRAAATRSATTSVLLAGPAARAARPGWRRAPRPAGRPGRAAGRTAGPGSAPGHRRAGAVGSPVPDALARTGTGWRPAPAGSGPGSGRRAAGPGDGDLAGLQRLAQRVQHRRRELRRLVEEQHAAVGQRRRARAGPAPLPPPTTAAIDARVVRGAGTAGAVTSGPAPAAAARRPSGPR